MPAPQWEVDQLTNPPGPEELADLFNEAIDMEAVEFQDPAKFRAAVARIMSAEVMQRLQEMARDMAGIRITRVVTALRHFRGDPQITADAINVLAGGHRADGVKISQIAKWHGITRQSFHERVLRVAEYIGIPYRRTKPRH